jgi:hypothetical protein
MSGRAMLAAATAVALTGCGAAHIVRLAPAAQTDDSFVRDDVVVESVGSDSVRVELELDRDVPPGAVTACFLGDLTSRHQERFLNRWRPTASARSLDPISSAPTVFRTLVRPGDRASRRVEVVVDQGAFTRMQGQPLLVARAPTGTIAGVECPSADTPDSLFQAFDVDLGGGRRTRVRPLEGSEKSLLGGTAAVSFVGDSLRIDVRIRRAGPGPVVACLGSTLPPQDRAALSSVWFPDDRASTERGRVPAFVSHRTPRGQQELSFQIAAADTADLDGDVLLVRQLPGDISGGAPTCSRRVFGPDAVLFDIDVETESRTGLAAMGVGLGVFLIILGAGE